VCGGLLAFAPAASAEDDHRLDEAWKAALRDFEGVLDQKQHVMINSIAYHAAAAGLCDGIDLDADKVGKAMNEIASANDDNLTDEQRLQRLSDILINLGTARGIFLAEGSLQKDEFCKAALASKADTENETFWK
jgi:hypothetical protein